MRLHRILLAPWVATPRSARWMFAFVLLLLVVIDVFGHIYGLPRHASTLSAAMLAMGNGAFWLLLMPNGLFLLLAARRLRLPGISPDVLWSSPLYAALGIGVPLLCQFPHGHVLSFAIVQVLVAAGATLFMLMPNYLGLSLYFLLVVAHRALSSLVSIPGPFDERFVSWGGSLAVVLVLALGWRWGQLLRGDYAENGLRAPSLINFRRNLGAAQRDPLTDAGLIRARPDWMMVRPALRDAGAHAPMRALRIALGGVYLPQTITGRLYQFVPAALIVALMGLICFVVTLDDHGLAWSLRYVFSRDAFGAWSWLFAAFSLMIVMMPVELLTLRWARANAELSLLALLPGMGNASEVKRVLLRTALFRPAMRLGLLLLAGWLGVISLDAGWPVALAMLVVALGCLGYLCAMALDIFGGRPLPAFGKSLLLMAMFVLLSLTILLPPLWHDWSRLHAATADDALIVAWLMLGAVLSWLARRGWHALRQRAHPFLSS